MTGHFTESQLDLAPPSSFFRSPSGTSQGSTIDTTLTGHGAISMNSKNMRARAARVGYRAGEDKEKRKADPSRNRIGARTGGKGTKERKREEKKKRQA